MPPPPLAARDDTGVAAEPPPGAPKDAGTAPIDAPAEPLEDAGAPPSSPSAPLPPPGTVRFAQLAADSEVLGREVACVGDFNLLDENGQTLDRTLWQASADSAEPSYLGGAPAQQAIDDDVLSLWHTAWFGLEPTPGYPHFLQVDLGAFVRISAFRYLPRRDSSPGRIAAFRFFVSTDGVTWGEPVASGAFPNDAIERTVPIARD